MFKSFIKISALIIFASVFFFSCDVEGMGNSGTLKIIAPGGNNARLIWNEFKETLRYRVDCSGPGKVSRNLYPGGTESVALAAGRWTVTITIFNTESREVGRKQLDDVIIRPKTVTTLDLVKIGIILMDDWNCIPWEDFGLDGLEMPKGFTAEYIFIVDDVLLIYSTTANKAIFDKLDAYADSKYVDNVEDFSYSDESLGLCVYYNYNSANSTMYNFIVVREDNELYIIYGNDREDNYDKLLKWPQAVKWSYYSGGYGLTSPFDKSGIPVSGLPISLSLDMMGEMLIGDIALLYVQMGYANEAVYNYFLKQIKSNADFIEVFDLGDDSEPIPTYSNYFMTESSNQKFLGMEYYAEERALLIVAFNTPDPDNATEEFDDYSNYFEMANEFRDEVEGKIGK